MIIPLCITGSLCPTCVADRLISLSVKHSLSLHFCKLLVVYWFLTNLTIPLKASDTFLEATAPVKLTLWNCPLFLKRTFRFNPRNPKVSFSLWFIKVFHWRFHSLVFYTKSNQKQYQITVKLHRVFASSGRQTASARLIQFHWETSGDSRATLPHSCWTTFNGQGISLL